MKSFQQNLLIALALALCGLSAGQWYLQANQRKTITDLDEINYKLTVNIQGYTNSIKAMEAEIDGLQGRLADLKREATSNSQELILQKRAVLRLGQTTEFQSNEIAQYQSVTNLLTTRLLAAYDGVKKQNEAIKELVAQRDEFVQKYNDSVKARNELTEKYNALVERINKLQPSASNSQRPIDSR